MANCDFSHYELQLTYLNRKLLYTMYTRAQETDFIFGEMDDVQKAISNNTSAGRHTCLKYRLEGLL